MSGNLREEEGAGRIGSGSREEVGTAAVSDDPGGGGAPDLGGRLGPEGWTAVPGRRLAPPQVQATWEEEGHPKFVGHKAPNGGDDVREEGEHRRRSLWPLGGGRDLANAYFP